MQNLRAKANKISAMKLKALMLAPKILKNFIEFKAGKPAPLFASFSVTGRCNLHCAYCDWWKEKMPELSTTEALRVIDNVCSLGVAFFDFSGGEPLLRKDLALLAKRASSRNCIVSMNTNGTLLKSADAPKIAEAFDIVVFSLDGPPEIHDKIRGVAGTCKKAFEAIKFLKAHGVKVGVNSVVSPWNIKALPQFIEELRSIVDFVQVQPVHPYPPPPDNKPPLKEVSRLQEYLLKLKSDDPGFLAVSAEFIWGFRLFFEGKAPKICHAGRLYVAVDPFGRLLACAARGDIVFGDVLRRSAAELLGGKGESDCWLKVDSCRGCWLECTVGASMAAAKPLTETLPIMGHVRRI
ncbi:MAG: radical SAM/SPASM domain-containing protein [Candidatus Bathyarchaeales archaeon]